MSHLLEIRATVFLRETKDFGIGDLAHLARDVPMDDALLVFEDTDLQALVLWTEQNLMTMEAVERLGRVLAG